MARIPKYRRGRLIKSICELDRQLRRERTRGYVYFGTRPMHPSWLANMQLATLRGFIARRTLYRAEPTQLQQRSNDTWPRT